MFYRNEYDLWGQHIILYSQEPWVFDRFSFEPDAYLGKENEKRNPVFVYAVKKKCKLSNRGRTERLKKDSWDIHLFNWEENPRGVIGVHKRVDGEWENVIILADNSQSLTILLRSVMIRTMMKYRIDNGCFPLHASGVMKGTEGFLFLADSEGGKSTTYFSFLNAPDYKLLSDDMVFCKVEQNGIRAYGSILKPSLREGTLSHVSAVKKFQTSFGYYQNAEGMQDQIFVNVRNETADKNPVWVRKGFILSFSKTMKIQKIEDEEDLRKKILISIAGFRATKPDTFMVQFINQLLEKIEWFDLSLPSDMDTFPERFEKCLKDLKKQ